MHQAQSADSSESGYVDKRLRRGRNKPGAIGVPTRVHGRWRCAHEQRASLCTIDAATACSAPGKELEHLALRSPADGEMHARIALAWRLLRFAPPDGSDSEAGMNPDSVGWAASVVLMATLIQQVVKQATEDSAQGVSKWLFAGQIVASAGFVLYSALVGNLVFVVTNSCILATAVVGQIISARKRRARARR